MKKSFIYGIVKIGWFLKACAIKAWRFLVFAIVWYCYMAFMGAKLYSWSNALLKKKKKKPTEGFVRLFVAELYSSVVANSLYLVENNSNTQIPIEFNI